MTRSNTGTQTLPTGGASTVLFPTKDSAIGGISYNASTGVFRVCKTGLYNVEYALRVNPPSMFFNPETCCATGAEVQFWVSVNGNDVPRYASSSVGPVSTVFGQVQLTNGSTLVSLQCGDEVEIRAYPTGLSTVQLDGTTTESNHAGLVYLGPACVPKKCNPCSCKKSSCGSCNSASKTNCFSSDDNDDC
jgi:hypothetical protein